MTDTAHAAIIQFWCDAYVAHVGAKYPFNGGKDGSTIKWLRGIYSDEDIRAYITAFFEMDDEFIQQSGYALGVFRGCLPKVIKAVTQVQQPDVNGHVPRCRTATECRAKLEGEIEVRRQQRAAFDQKRSAAS